jgi:hypothetical protein
MQRYSLIVRYISVFGHLLFNVDKHFFIVEE